MSGEPGTEADKLEWACRQIERLLARQAGQEKLIAEHEEALKMLAKCIETMNGLRAIGL